MRDKIVYEKIKNAVLLTDEKINEILSEKKKRGRPKKEKINEKTE